MKPSYPSEGLPRKNSMSPTYELNRGSSPLLVSMPHIGTSLPASMQSAYVERALAAEDTDWHLARLYNFLPELGASVLRPHISRYVIDLNRPPDDAPMYPGSANTELCPTHFFTGDALYKNGHGPRAAARAARKHFYWEPYHSALTTELERIKAQHGYALLWDAHSIRSKISWLFEGTLPSLNIGTANGDSANDRIAQALEHVCNENTEVSHVINGRFKGGYITRHYGTPLHDIHAVQLEMCQVLYMQEEAPYSFDETKARAIRPLLKTMMIQALNACKSLYGN